MSCHVIPHRSAQHHIPPRYLALYRATPGQASPFSLIQYQAKLHYARPQDGTAHHGTAKHIKVWLGAARRQPHTAAHASNTSCHTTPHSPLHRPEAHRTSPHKRGCVLPQPMPPALPHAESPQLDSQSTTWHISHPSSHSTHKTVPQADTHNTQRITNPPKSWPLHYMALGCATSRHAALYI